MKKHQNSPGGDNQGQTRFYLIFNELAKTDIEDDYLSQEIQEIELISRVVEDVTVDDQPRFTTST